jgi:hypothetical protein
MIEGITEVEHELISSFTSLFSFSSPFFSELCRSEIYELFLEVLCCCILLARSRCHFDNMHQNKAAKN